MKISKSILYVFLAVILIGVLGTVFALSKTAETAHYTNPVFEPVLADPSVIRGEDGYFYAYGTEDDWGDGKGPKLVPIVKSKDLTNWEYVGEAFEKKPTWKNVGGIWAPDIEFFNGKYKLYYSLSIWGDTNPGIGVATSDTPVGPFEDQGPVFTSADIGVGNSIDPMVYVKEDGTPYLFWGSFHGIFAVELTKDGLDVAGEKRHIAGNELEAAYVIRRNNSFYLFGSAGSCCEGEKSGYHVVVGKSDSLLGPYVDKDGNGLLQSKGTLVMTGNMPSEEGKVFVGPGHTSVVKDDEGTDWLIYHAIEYDDSYLPNGATRRPLMIDPIIWKDGWPTVEGLVPSTEKQKAPVFDK
ncbi:family 43 glycosylhydrolase [Thalassobacillus pellis]|uniref:family 43 glycosylhydrolase n=1 Tax=Thalassobacillus pellis TaxID=748008 RepID=UPI00195F9C06|nr:family 43 glycosylhydrolase [Thalassobacillus pellis]MBM7551505.1 arabinan endo-1,5-alpha-L-arabinosidase [Thalassobacillus pellis]